VQGAAVSQAAFGERIGLERVFLEHQGRVFRAAFRITGNAHDAEDVLQTVFLRLARQGEEGLAVTNLSSYLYRAAINSALDLLRGRRDRAGVPLDEADSAPGGALAAPDQAQEAAEIRGRLREALAGLPPRTAEIFVLRYFEDQANRDIARVLGISRVSVAVTLHRARRHLQDQLGAWRRGGR
jgi:RNA polymerase sigma-70 factor (ECF subfamily)